LIPNSSSIDGIKKSEGYPGSLRGYFEKMFGAGGADLESSRFKNAIQEYVKSMAAYSVLSWLLAFKDRLAHVLDHSVSLNMCWTIRSREKCLA
jgi:hypothetical protein